MKQKVEQKNKHIMKANILSIHLNEINNVVTIRFSYEDKTHTVTFSASKIRYTRTGIISYIDSYIKKYNETTK